VLCGDYHRYGAVTSALGYVEDVLRKTVCLAVSSSAISVVTSVWYWGVAKYVASWCAV
jgi:hypothetical protein